MNEAASGSVSRQVELPLSYYFEEARAPKRLIVLLHGFEQRAEKILEPLRSVLPESASILAPNGPFPLPRRAPTTPGTPPEWHVGHSWYFYDMKARRFAIGMEPAIALITAAIEAVGHADTDKVVIGFSQGGWLAPVLAYHLKCVKQVIGIGCEYARERTPPPVSFRIDGVHGDRDGVVPVEGARVSHQRLLATGVHGRFIEIPGSGHAFEPGVIAAVQELLALAP